jgi:exonuclease VII small subunit
MLVRYRLERAKEALDEAVLLLQRGHANTKAAYTAS